MGNHIFTRKIHLDDPVFHISDTHFGHESILRFTKRGKYFSTADQMDKHLIEQWNSIVPERNATVIHYGDFCFKDKKYTQHILNQLNGRIILLKGNHDNPNYFDNHPKIMNFVYELLLKVKLPNKENRRLIYCSHAPLWEWHQMYAGAYHVYGHLHGNNKLPFFNTLDVGIDSLFDMGLPLFRPITTKELLQLIDINFVENLLNSKTHELTLAWDRMIEINFKSRNKKCQNSLT